MRFEEFQRAAHAAWKEIPDEYKEGVDGLTVRRDALPHPILPDIYTLGHCLTEAYPSDWTGPETLRSIVVLYHGSFRKLAQLDPEFDWEGELWETLTHEVRHHLESLAAEEGLEGVDYALDEGFQRAEGYEFDPWYYQSGDPVAPGVYQVENHFFIERELTPDQFARLESVGFAWHGAPYEIPRPEELGDVHFVWIHDVDVGPAWLELVLVRKRSLWEGLKAAFRKEAPVVLESEARARPASPGP